MNSTPEHAWYVRYTYSILKNVFGPLVKFIWIKDVFGIENIPSKGSAIVAFNHQSYLDFLCFGAICPRPIHFLTAEKFFSHPLWNPVVKSFGQIKVHRNEHEKDALHATVHSHLKNGKLIGIFPEGTRSLDPIEMLHAFTGVAKYAVNGSVPIIPVGIKGTHTVLSKNDKRPKFKKIVSFHIGKPIYLHNYYGKELCDTDYRNITDEVMLKISVLSGKNYSYVGKLDRDPKPNTLLKQ